MLISVQNILGGQLSAISAQHLEIELPLSKSESNRALMIAHYAGIQEFKDLEVPLSNSDDTLLLQKHLDTLDKYLQSPLFVDGCPLTLDCHNAGTVFRFLMTAVANQCIMHNAQFIIDEELSSKQLSNLATQQLSILLTGSERMKLRPISSLVDALLSILPSVMQSLLNLFLISASSEIFSAIIYKAPSIAFSALSTPFSSLIYSAAISSMLPEISS